MIGRFLRRAAWCLPALLLAGCVSTPEDTYSSADLATLRERGWHPDFYNVSASQLEDRVRREVATPVSFHGLVVDERGSPIADHPVRVTLFDRVLHPFESPYYGWVSLPELRTDRDGGFSITDHEGAVLIVSVSDASYWDIDEGRAQRVYYYADARLRENTHPLPLEEDAPAVFRLARRPEQARTTLVRLGSIRLAPGRTAGIALDHPRYTVAPELADLRVNLRLGPRRDDGRYDWTLEIHVPGGGIQRATTLFLDRAPDSGYDTDLSFGYAAKDTDWRHRAELQCFLRTAEGQYAALTFHARTLEEPFVSISGKVNLHGGRILD